MIGHNKPPLGEGWIARHRSVRDHWLVGHGIHVKPADPTRKLCSTQGEAWEDLLMECRYEDGTVSNGGKKMELRRGELVGAVSWLAHRWNWTPKTVRRFLDQLEKDGMIELTNPAAEKGNQIGRQANVITVCNYEAYQTAHGSQEKSKGQPQDNQRATTGRPEGNIYKDNKGTKEQEKTISFAHDERVTFEKGELQLFNGVRQFWLNEFGDEHALNLALKQAAGYVQPNSMRPLEAQVSSQLARMARDKRDKDTRYAKAVKDNPKGGGSKRLSLDELSAGVDAAYERQFSTQPKTPRLTHER